MSSATVEWLEPWPGKPCADMEGSLSIPRLTMLQPSEWNWLLCTDEGTLRVSLHRSRLRRDDTGLRVRGSRKTASAPRGTRSTPRGVSPRVGVLASS